MKPCLAQGYLATEGQPDTEPLTPTFCMKVYGHEEEHLSPATNARAAFSWPQGWDDVERHADRLDDIISDLSATLLAASIALRGAGRSQDARHLDRHYATSMAAAQQAHYLLVSTHRNYAPKG